MIDLHFHVLPAIDDGPATIAESLALVQAAAASGTKTIIATPHVSWRYPNDAETIKHLTDQLNVRLAEEDTMVEVLPGAEIAMTKVGDTGPDELTRLSLGGSKWLLIEPPFAATAPAFDAIVIDLIKRGHGVVIAHPERCQALHRRPETLAELVRAGALTSLTAGSLTGRFGTHVRRFAQRLIDASIVHNIASDAHDIAARPPALAAEIEQAGLGNLREWLTELVPAAILADDPIPPQPALQAKSPVRQRSGLMGRLLGR